MYSTFHGLEIGKRAILAQQTALNTTGQNIANANTAGYTRQEAVLQSTKPLAYPNIYNGTTPMTMGTGVEVSEFRRIREGYLDSQYRGQQQNAGYWEAKSTALSNVETIFNEPSDAGLNMTLDRFWQSLQELSKQPDSLAARSLVLANGKSVADGINGLTTALSQNEKDLQVQLGGKISDINSSVYEIAALNKQIAVMTSSGYNPNDLLDKRDLLIDKLSKSLNVQTAPGQNGAVNLSIGGIAIVNGSTAGTLSVDTETGKAMVDGNTVNLNGGEVKGLIDTLTGTDSGSIPSLKNNIDLLAKSISEQMNAIHAGNDARSMDDIQNRAANPSTPLEQNLFFVDKDDPTQPPKNAANMIVNPILVNSPSMVAAAKLDSIGDGSNAKAMADVQFQKVDIGGNNITISDFYQTVIGQLGMNVQDAKRWSDNAGAASQQIDNQRQSVSGVSIDEEMTNMVRFQQAYNAAAKYVTAIDDMLDKLINGMK